MKLRTILGGAVPLALAATLSAQTPIPYPSGCPIPFTFTNETSNTIEIAPCLPQVLDSTGQPLSLSPCQQVAVLLPPGETHTIYWLQDTDSAPQVPDGIYQVGSQLYDISSQIDAAVEPLGPPRVGLQRSFHLCSRNGAGQLYLLLASGSSNAGFALCGSPFPLDIDALLLAQITGSPVFVSFLGFLDAEGRSTDPALALPMMPALAGLDVHLAFAAVDPLTPCGVGDVSPARVVTIQP